MSAQDQLALRIVANRYVRALFEYAGGKNQQDAVEKDLRTIKEILAKSSELNKFIHNPILSRAQAKSGMETLLTHFNASDVTLRFVKLLADNRRLAALPEVIERYMAMLAEAKGIVIAEITTAKPLNEKERTELSQALKKAVGRDVQLKSRENPAILGGMIVSMGGRMVDNSLRGKMEQLRAGLSSQPLQHA